MPAFPAVPGARTRHALPCLLAALVAALALTGARADIYRWTDATGTINLSNAPPPAGASDVRFVPAAPRPPTSAVPVPAPPAPVAEMQQLAERVRDLEVELDSARRAPPAAAPTIVYAPVVVTPPVQPEPVLVHAAPASPYPPGYACDPLVYGCWYGLPFGVYPGTVLVWSGPVGARPVHPGTGRPPGAHPPGKPWWGPGGRPPRASVGPSPVWRGSLHK